MTGQMPRFCPFGAMMRSASAGVTELRHGGRVAELKLRAMTSARLFSGHGPMPRPSERKCAVSGELNDLSGRKNNAHRGRRMRWASFVVIDDWEEECRQSIEAHWEEESAASNSMSGNLSRALSGFRRSGAPPPSFDALTIV